MAKKYPTWQEAGAAAVALGIKNSMEYHSLCHLDPKLPHDPWKKYKNFPGFSVFLGGEKKDLYPTWQEAGAAAIALGITKYAEYVEKRKNDKRLPSYPTTYYKDFPGMKIFLSPQAEEAGRGKVIIDGPSKWDLALSLMDNENKIHGTVKFVTHNQVFCVAIRRLERVNDSDEKFAFGGYLPNRRKDVKSQQFVEISGFYDSKVKCGRIE